MHLHSLGNLLFFFFFFFLFKGEPAAAMGVNSIDEQQLFPPPQTTTTDVSESDLQGKRENAEEEIVAKKDETINEDEDEQLSVNLRTNRKSIVPVVEVKPIVSGGPFLVRYSFRVHSLHCVNY